MKDFEPDDLAKIELVRKKFLHLAEMFSFSMMEPSPIELLSTLEAKSGSAIRDEIYHFADRGKRDIALRFDFTVGIARYVTSQQSLRLPAKFSSFGGVFRYDEPQKGRYRFFHQWNLEVFGKPSLESEAELIEFASRLYDSLGLHNIEIHINHRSIVESFIRNNYPYFDPKKAEQIFADAFRLVDKAQKKSRAELCAEYKQLPADFVNDILDFATLSGTPQEIESKSDTSTLESWDHIKQLWRLLENRSVKNAKINFGIVRGLDYYSGVVFEVFCTSSQLGALAGGGRYDSLTKTFGREEIGAAGMAGGVERTILCMDEQNITHASKTRTVSILYTNEQMQRHAIKLASQLRAKDIPVAIDLVARQLKKQMEAAADSEFTIIVGPKELEQNQVVLRNMQNRTESALDIDDLMSSPAKYLSL